MNTMQVLGAFGIALSVAVIGAPSNSLAEATRHSDPSWIPHTLPVTTATEGLPAEPRNGRAKVTVTALPASVDAGTSVTLKGSSVGLRRGSRVYLEIRPTEGKSKTVSQGTIRADGSWTLRTKAVPLGKTAYRVVAVAGGKIAATRRVAITGYTWASLDQVTTSRTVNGQRVIDGRLFPTQLGSNSSFRPTTLLPGPLAIPAGCKTVEIGGGFDDGGDGTMTVFAGTDAETFLRVEVPGASGAIGTAQIPKRAAFTVTATDVTWSRYNGVGTSVAYAGGRAYCSFTLR